MESKDKYLRLLDTAFIKRRITHVGLFILSYETLKSYVLDSSQSFFSDDHIFENGKIKHISSQEHKDEVLSLGRNPLEANINWLIKMDVLSQEDAIAILRLKEYRGRVVHDPSSIFSQDDSLFFDDAIDILRGFHRRISNFWGKIEMEIASDIDSEDIDYDGICSGLSILLDYMATALESDNLAK